MENLFLVKRVHTHLSVLDSTESLVFRVVLPVWSVIMTRGGHSKQLMDES